ncbi:hypothetical protein LOTGIDRAFT_108201 [Lottia gigantea]|uniref:Uncharacterized protein n=1 Tax=Lottia gigantea TaxID=225164 RepID=V3Z105_LOTGI|nr:hypothetical protein LOTGIDRAFT_108201 [Lottia gigantea]ESO84213.1 hypothetical protein LOTGIDRAFT_108201 [Lottia gigantea]
MPAVIRAKCIVVGDAGVGKSSMCQLFSSDGAHFPKNYTMTIGAEFMIKPVVIPDTQDTVELYIYDSAGKEIFSDMVIKFWDHPSMVIVVYDVTNESSFSSCEKWLERVRSQKPDLMITGVLVANKIDLDQRRLISPKAGKELAHRTGLDYYECSAKEMQNVDTPFYFLASEYYKLYHEKLEMFKACVA